MEEKKQTKISLKAIIIICVVVTIVGGGLVSFIIKSNIDKTANKSNENTTSNSNNVDYYNGKYVFANNSLGIFNKLGLNWIEVNTYEDYLSYLDKIKESYTIDSSKESNLYDNFNQDFFDKGKIALIEYSANSIGSLKIEFERAYSGFNIEPKLYVCYSEPSEGVEALKSKLYLIPTINNFNFKKPEVVRETESERMSRELFKNLPPAAKPIIYLYPENNITVDVTLGNPDKITCSYPKYIDGWTVNAKPNGDLKYVENGKDLYALYYESENIYNYEVEKEGFIVKSEDVADFLDEKLAVLGLTPREAEEFIVYWLPKLEDNEYNYIRFATIEEINRNMPLEINPKPDSLIRVMMTYKGLDTPIEVEEQKLEKIERNGFVAVEWGGTEIK